MERRAENDAFEEKEDAEDATAEEEVVREEEEERGGGLVPPKGCPIGEKMNVELMTTTLAKTEEQSQSRANELGLHEQWRSVLRAERRAKEEERKEERKCKGETC